MAEQKSRREQGLADEAERAKDGMLGTVLVLVPITFIAILVGILAVI